MSQLSQELQKLVTLARLVQKTCTLNSSQFFGVILASIHMDNEKLYQWIEVGLMAFILFICLFFCLFRVNLCQFSHEPYSLQKHCIHIMGLRLGLVAIAYISWD